MSNGVNNMNKTNRSPLKQLIYSHLARAKWKLALATLSLLGVIAMELAAPWPIKIIIDHILLAKPLTPALSFLQPLFQSGMLLPMVVIACSIFLIVVISGAFSYFKLLITSKISYELVYVLRRELFSHVQQFSLSFHQRNRSGELLTKVSSDTNALKDIAADWGLMVVSDVILLNGILVIMFSLNWQLATMVALTLPMLAIVLYRLNRRVKTSLSKQRKQEGKMASRINEVLSSIALVQAFGRQEYEEERFEIDSSRNLEEGVRTARATAAVSTSMALISALGTAATVLFGSWLALQGKVTPGELLIFVAYVNGLYKPIRDLGKLSVKFSRAAVSANRIGEILAMEPDIRDRADAIEARGLSGDIRFDNVSFGYPDGKQVLDHVSFHVRAGQRVALVGASGTGKSTIVNLILRLYEAQQGAVMVDAVDVANYQRESLRREIGIVLQDTVLFGVSIRENIAYGKPDATSEEVEQAARDAHAHEFIMELPDGYDTVLGERGGTISGGQRQRICLARAIIKHPSILILDEPTSAVDSVSAGLITDAITRVQKGKTTLVIAHQFSLMNGFDQILVLKNGKIVESGRHDHLLSVRGHYYELLQHKTA